MDIKYIKDNEGTNFFPVAHEKGIIDNNGTTLESKIGTLNDAMSSKADKATTYTKAEVNNLIPSVDNDTLIVDTLPASGVANTIYRVPGTNSYTDYAWDGTLFVALGTFTGNVNDGYAYMGVATTSTTPDTSDPNVYYIAGEAGTYTNFNNLLHTGGIGIFKWDGSVWSYQNVPSSAIGLSENVPEIENTTDADLDISDENDNVLARFSNGDVKTKNFDSSVTPQIITDNSTADLKIADENGNVLVKFNNGGIETKNFSSNVKFPYSRRTAFTTTCNTTNFLVSDFVADSINTIETIALYDDNCVLYLPSSYTINGEPTKIIIYCKHGASTIEPSADDIVSGDMGKIFRYMLYLGYGILAADGVPNGWATALKLGERVVGNYVAVQSTIRAFNYVKANYNIDSERVFIFGYSQGGHYAQNVIDNSDIPIVAAAELSPVCSMRYHQWDLNASGSVDGVSYTKLARLNIARIFNFPAVTNNTELLALEYDPSKTIGYDPWNRNVEYMYEGFVQDGNLWKLPTNVSLDSITMKKHCRCPLKIWAATNDTLLGTDVTKVFIKAIKNSGQVADIQLYTSGGHSIPSAQTSIGTFVENGETCNLYPIAKDIAMWFYNFGGY